VLGQELGFGNEVVCEARWTGSFWPGELSGGKAAALVPVGDVGVDGADSGFDNGTPVRRSARKHRISKSEQ